MNHRRELYRNLRKRQRPSLDLFRTTLENRGYRICNDSMLTGQLAREGFDIGEYGFFAFKDDWDSLGKSRYVAVGIGESLMDKAVYVVRGLHDKTNVTKGLIKDFNNIPERLGKSLFAFGLGVDIALVPFTYLSTGSPLATSAVFVFVAGGLRAITYIGSKSAEWYFSRRGIEYGYRALDSAIEKDKDEQSIRRSFIDSMNVTGEYLKAKEDPEKQASQMPSEPETNI